MQRYPGNNVLRHVRITHMYAVYDAHTAEKVIDILDGGPARQVSDLDKHVVCLCYYIFIP
jgi:hypothetical protein